MKLQEMPITKIKITENHRVNIEKSSLEDLMQSIKQDGLKHPIGVAQKGDVYILRFGQRRLLAFKKLGYKTIPVTVTAFEDDKNLMIENLAENMQRRDPSFAEMGRMIKKLEDDHDLSIKEISVRLGMPVGKIQQIIKVYSALPEKYRRKVVFMEKGGGRGARKGCIPANVATKIADMKKHHGLKDKAVDSVFKNVVEKGLDRLDLDNVGTLIGSGMGVEEAMENMTAYGVFPVSVVALHEEISELMGRYGLINRKHLFLRIMYGEAPPLVKPEFVSTGIALAKKKVKKESRAGFKKMRAELAKRSKSGKLSDEQKAALEPTAKLPVGEWTDEQCAQIKGIYEDTK